MTSAYVYDAVRTPFGRFGGALAKVRPDDLAATVLRAVVGRAPALDGGAVDEVEQRVVGTVAVARVDQAGLAVLEGGEVVAGVAAGARRPEAGVGSHRFRASNVVAGGVRHGP